MGGGGGSQEGILYINLENIGIVRYDLHTFTFVETQVRTDATAFGAGGDGFWYANGGPAAPRDLYRMLPDDPTFPLRLMGTGARAMEDIATSPDGTTFGVGEGWVFTIDRETGEQTDLFALGYESKGLGFTNEGKMLAAEGRNLYEVDPSTGESSLWHEFEWNINDLGSESGVPTGIESPTDSAGPVVLHQNHPNPFNPKTSIRFSLERGSEVSLQIFGSNGKRVRTLIDTYRSAGSHSSVWDGRDDAGQTLPSGVYHARIAANGVSDLRKMILLK